VAPFSKSVIGSRSYFVIRSSTTRDRPHVQEFVEWLIEEAKAALAADGKASASSRPPAARSGGAGQRARSAR
jgi:hypothetical protein